MKHIHTDIETYSSVDLSTCGMYRYAESPDFEVLLFGYAVDYGKTHVVDLKCGEKIPDNIIEALLDPTVTKHAWNAAFEWYCLSTHFGLDIDVRTKWIDQWEDSMLTAQYCGLPASLDKAGAAVGLPPDQQKMKIGKRLIQIFSVPNKRPTKAHPNARILPVDEPEKWKLYKEYNGQDVETEMAIDRKLSPWEVPDWVQKQWRMTLMQNSRGVSVDMEMVNGAIAIANKVAEELTEEAKVITGLENPNSVAQLKPWLEDRVGTDISSLDKENVEMLLKEEIPEDVRRVLEIRQEVGTSAVKKYDTLFNMTSSDGQAKGMMVFYGANRSGRFSSRGVQFQNMKRTYVQHLDYAREIVKAADDFSMRLAYGNVTDSLGQLVRTALAVPEGHLMLDADYSAIEARVIAWISAEDWRLDIFRNGGDIYCESASRIYGVPVKKHGENGHLRQRGKVAELALGYAGGVGAMRAMDVSHALDDLPDSELQKMVNDWRKASPNIVKLWSDCDKAARMAIQTGQAFTVGTGCKITYRYEHGNGLNFLTAELPSGRKLFYAEPHMGINRFGQQSLYYMGQNQTTKKWCEVDIFSGKYVENLVQAISRDLLCEAIERLEAAGFPVEFSIHDEVVIDLDVKGDYSHNDELLTQVANIMSINPSWATGLPLNAEGWHGMYFRKDG